MQTRTTIGSRTLGSAIGILVAVLWPSASLDAGVVPSFQGLGGLATTNAKLLDHDILDSSGEIQALINVLGAGSDAGQALAQFVPEPTALSLLMLFGGLVLSRRRRRVI